MEKCSFAALTNIRQNKFLSHQISHRKRITNKLSTLCICIHLALQAPSSSYFVFQLTLLKQYNLTKSHWKQGNNLSALSTARAVLCMCLLPTAQLI